MSEIAIDVNELSKRYRIGLRENKNDTFMGALTSWVRSPLKNYRSLKKLSTFDDKAEAKDIIWALKDVSFQVNRGEVVGIIGHNGAGKSTLLKVLSRITEPTAGWADIGGRVSSLLEVGTGFHKELTGRENVYLNGTILGMTKGEVEDKFDEIVAFSGVEKFIDTPVKRYSSGMKVRLAFSVAAHLEPEILLIDEVLAVGDAAFQKKCLGKMNEVAGEGRTVLFVSHNMVAVQNLCKRVIWFHGGKVAQDGLYDEVVNSYLSAVGDSLTRRIWDEEDDSPGNEDIRIRQVQVNWEGEDRGDPITMDSEILLTFDYKNPSPGAYLHLTIHLVSERGVTVFSSASVEDPNWNNTEHPAGLFRTTCRIPANLLNNGMYHVNLIGVLGGNQAIYRHEQILAFEVVDSGKRAGSWYGKEPGIIRPSLDWMTEPLDVEVY